MKETNLLRWIIVLPIFAVVLTSFILTNIFLSSIYEKHRLEIQSLKEKHINNLKSTIKERIDHLSIILDNSYKQQLNIEKRDIKNIVDLGYKMINDIYQNNQHLSKKALYALINERMKNIRFFDNNSGYYFIYDLEKGTSISLPSAPSLVGTSLVNLVDVKGKNLFDSYDKILQRHGEGFDTWHWNKPNEKEHKEKVGFIKKFAPLNIGIGTAVYTEDIKNNISKNALNSITKLFFADDSYIFVLDTHGKVLHHKQKRIINLPLDQLDDRIQQNIRNIIFKATSAKGTFLEYVQSKKLFDSKSIPSKKISYVKYIPSLDWVIGTGLYTDKLQAEINQKSAILNERLQDDIMTIIIIATTASIIIILLLLILAKKINKRFNFYNRKLRSRNAQLKKLNEQLEEKVEKQVKKIRQKDLMLNQQSKQSAMGEMIGNISHQWRQPLSAISTLASGILVQKDLGIMEDEQLDIDLQNIVESTKVLSSTIDDFRNFYSSNKQMTKFSINEPINKVLNLISANLSNYEVTIIKEIQEIEINSYKNEILQVLLNIINNAKDALKTISDKRYLFISTQVQHGELTITILDNANGIPEDIINKVFDPYFTTKIEEKGTGIGLYMSKNLLENSLSGTITVQNKTFNHENKTYTGAEFTITLPLDKNND